MTDYKFTMVKNNSNLNPAVGGTITADTMQDAINLFTQLNSDTIASVVTTLEIDIEEEEHITSAIFITTNLSGHVLYDVAWRES